MYDIQTRYGAYKRGVIYFTIYSAILFFATSAEFLQLKTILYFLLGYAISGAVAVLFMSWQHKIESKLNQKRNLETKIFNSYNYCPVNNGRGFIRTKTGLQIYTALSVPSHT